MKLTTNFTSESFEKSNYAETHGIDNSIPNDKVLTNLKSLTRNVLQPIRDKWGRTNITSGFRCLQLNRALGSKDTSQHTKGQAADIQFLESHGLYDIFKQIVEDDMNYDQIIYEDSGNSTWIHISWSHKPRKIAMTSHKENGKMVYINYRA